MISTRAVTLFAQIVLTYSSINSNVQMTAFWMMVYILQDPYALDNIRAEIASIMETLQAREGLSGPITARLTTQDFITSCPLLNSAFNETLRVASTGSSIREVTRTVHVRDKILTKGTQVILPHRQLLMAEEAFGHDAKETDLARFAKDKSLERHPYYKPFGGGVTLCTGRFLGKREVLAFVALALWRYDFHVIQRGEEALGVKGMATPRLDEAKPSLGVSKQVEGDDMIVSVKQR